MRSVRLAVSPPFRLRLVDRGFGLVVAAGAAVIRFGKHVRVISGRAKGQGAAMPPQPMEAAYYLNCANMVVESRSSVKGQEGLEQRLNRETEQRHIEGIKTACQQPRQAKNKTLRKDNQRPPP